MALYDDILSGLTPQNGREFDDLNQMLERLRAVKVADSGEDYTPGFGMAVQNMPPETGKKPIPQAEAPSSASWRPSVESNAPLEQATPQKMSIPQTAPITRTQQPAAAPASPAGSMPKAPGMQTGGQQPGQAQRMPQPDFWDRLGAFSRGYNTGGLVGAVADGFGSGLDRQVENQNQTAQALVKMGVSPDLVNVAIRNPDVMKAMLTAAFTKQLAPAQWQIDEIYDEKSGRKRKVLRNPQDPTRTIPIGGEALGRDQGLNPTEQKTLNTAEDENNNLVNGTIPALQRALELNPQTYTGYTSGMRGWLGSAAPKDSWVGDLIEWGGLDRRTSEATSEWKSIMSPEAIKQMSATLTGATTNFELQKFEDVLSDPDVPVEQRRRIIERMLKLAERKRDLNDRRIQEMRAGGVQVNREGASEPVAPTAAPQQKIRGVPDQPPPNARRAKDGKIYIQNPNKPGSWLLWEPEGNE